MEIKETCKQQRTFENYVTQIARLMAEMPTAAWQDVLNYVYLKWKVKEEEARENGEQL